MLQPKRSSTLAIAVPGVALVAIVFALLPLRPPRAAGPDAPETAFSAARALQHVEDLARASHPSGSAEHRWVRDEIVRRIGGTGLESELQDRVVVNRPAATRIEAVRVSNVLARLPGEDPDGVVLLMAHYDTVRNSPGAADDTAGVATLLETMRALAAAPPLRNDLVFLFTDAEEVGLSGARTFLAHHRWAGDVRLVLNFEARGSRGPSIMFETGPVDAELMRGFARAAPHPLAASYSHDVYRRLPNDTDFSVFKRQGTPGFNFAFVSDFQSYHSSLDTVHRLDPRSLQHHGSYALSLGRHFGDAALMELPERGTAVYFNLPLVGLIVYPATWAMPLAVAAVIATLLLLGVGTWRRSLRPLRLLAALGLVPVAVVVAVGSIHLLNRLWQDGLGMTGSMLATPPWHLLVWIGMALGIAVALLRLLSDRCGAEPIAAAGALWWSAIAVAVAIALPSSSYLFTWPLIFTLPLLAVLLWRRRHGAQQSGRLHAWLMVLTPVPAILLWAPTLMLIGIAFGIDSAGVEALGTALVASLLAAPLAVRGSRRWPLPAALVAAASIILLVLTLDAGYGPARPQPDSLLYAVDHEGDEAFWLSYDRAPDEWTRPLLEDGERRSFARFFFRPTRLLVAPAPVLPMEPIHVRPSVPEGAAGDLLRLRFLPPPGVVSVHCRLSAGNAGLRVTRLARVLVPEDGPSRSQSLHLSFMASPPEGFEVEIDAGTAPRLDLEIVTHRLGLPTSGGAPGARPAHLRPIRFGMTDLTLARTVLTVPLDILKSTPGGARASTDEDHANEPTEKQGDRE